MSEAILINLLGVFGLVILALGIYLIRIDKKIEKRLTSNPTMWEEIMFQSRITGTDFTKTLGYVCVATGVALMIIFGITVLGLY